MFDAVRSLTHPSVLRQRHLDGCFLDPAVDPALDVGR